jgi:hypothetical protein
VEVPEFADPEAQKDEEVLREVRRYLNVLGFEIDVSAYMRERPFSYAATKAAEEE